MLAVKILGTGLYVPGEKISNAELKQITGLEFKSDKLEEKLGVFSRHMAHLRGIAETTADFATKAAQNAISDAGLSGDDIGLFIVGTDTPEYISPATAILVQGRIQKNKKLGPQLSIFQLRVQALPLRLIML